MISPSNPNYTERKKTAPVEDRSLWKLGPNDPYWKNVPKASPISTKDQYELERQKKIQSQPTSVTSFDANDPSISGNYGPSNTGDYANKQATIADLLAKWKRGQPLADDEIKFLRNNGVKYVNRNSSPTTSL